MTREHSIRMHDPGLFEQDSFRRKELRPGVYAILGRPLGETSLTVQALRFDVDAFTFAQAIEWSTSHGFRAEKWHPAELQAIGHPGNPVHRQEWRIVTAPDDLHAMDACVALHRLGYTATPQRNFVVTDAPDAVCRAIVGRVRRRK